MSVSLPLRVGVWMTAVITVAGIGYATLRPRANAIPNANLSPHQLAQLQACQTIATDPQPPLNIRSSPVVADNNVIGRVENGTVLAVVSQQSGWFRIATPVSGWVYQDLTATTCNSSAQPVAALALPTAPSVSRQTLTKAQERFHAGNLHAALELLQTVPAGDAKYAEAQAALQTMPAQWQQAESTFYKAQSALQESRWHDVLASVNQVPDIRFWREKMAPMVKQAIAHQDNRVAFAQI
jgi:Bacterial SH3 domain